MEVGFGKGNFLKEIGLLIIIYTKLKEIIAL